MIWIAKLVPTRYVLYVNLGFLLFQMLHLTWLATNFLLPSFFGTPPVSWFDTREASVFLSLADYIEVPVLIYNIVYIAIVYRIHRIITKNHVTTLIIVMLQFIHIYWLTDEVILENAYPIYLTMIAVIIDYTELLWFRNTIKELKSSGRN